MINEKYDQKYLVVRGDYNDGDIISEESKINNDQLDRIRKIALIIKKYNSDNGSSNNWPLDESRNPSIGETYKGLLTISDIQFMSSFCPSTEDSQIHKIESIEIYYKGEILL